MEPFTVGMKVGKIGSAIGRNSYHGTGVVEKIDGRGHLTVRMKNGEAVRCKANGHLFGTDSWHSTYVTPIEDYDDRYHRDRPAIARDELRDAVHRIGKLPIDAALAEKLIALVRELESQKE